MKPPLIRHLMGASIVLLLIIDTGGIAAKPSAAESKKPTRVVIRFPATEAAGQPSIAGDFTGWMLLVMERHGKEWTFPVKLSPGVYRFAFRNSDGKWFVPDSIPYRTDDGMGGLVAVLVVQ